MFIARVIEDFDRFSVIYYTEARELKYYVKAIEVIY